MTLSYKFEKFKLENGAFTKRPRCKFYTMERFK